MSELRITIQGQPGTGKSTVARAIKNSLHSAGITATIAGPEDEVPGALDRSWQTRLLQLAHRPGYSVAIDTVQAPLRIKSKLLLVDAVAGANWRHIKRMDIAILGSRKLECLMAQMKAGFLLRVQSDEQAFEGDLADLEKIGCSIALCTMMRYARHEGATMLRLDRDAPMIQGLESFD